MDNIKLIRQELSKNADPEKAVFLTRYFKAEHTKDDVFYGINVPFQRALSKKYFNKVTPEQCLKLIQSKYHEERLTGLFIWVLQFKHGDEATKQKIYNLYLKNTKWINNWDLVDTSARDIVGAYVFDKDQNVLDELSKSKYIWDRRIAMVATFYFIDKLNFAWTLKLSERYLTDDNDYIHKVTGWALREIGKRDRLVLIDFLDKFADKMPRTALRYAIEHFDTNLRGVYLKKRKGIE